MDSRLNERLKKWDEQIEVLAEIEKTYFQVEATEKSLEGMLYLKADGKTVEEKKSLVYQSDEWKNFKQELANLKADFNKELRILELRKKAYEGEYITMKIEAEMIQRGRGGQI